MLLSNQAHLFELQTQLWKARALAKQKWLEWVISEPADGPRAAARRADWIKRALEAVRRGQAEVRYRAALSEATAEHLSVLEKILIGAAERRPAPTESGAQTTRSDSVPAR
ncbi:MAG TPA: hypothetical protein VKE96_04795 [Vicinamibacterales bacterium]|nr:hypothetical protein [Vicinamibacterales bacterium]